VALVGLIFLLVGLALAYFARRTEGVSGAVLFLLGLLIFAFGVYALFFENGQGLGRWMDWIR
jgi:sulfite exporter TauE/SafE